jgi:hypothetical protein
MANDQHSGEATRATSVNPWMQYAVLCVRACVLGPARVLTALAPQPATEAASKRAKATQCGTLRRSLPPPQQGGHHL